MMTNSAHEGGVFAGTLETPERVLEFCQKCGLLLKEISGMRTLLSPIFVAIRERATESA
jgi:hypothetical protein